MIAPGRVFRSDEVDATHSPSFHQIEGLVIDKNVTFADLKGTLQEFAKELFGPETKTKFRPHHFPSQSRALRLMFPASNAAEKAAVSVRFRLDRNPWLWYGSSECSPYVRDRSG